LEVRQQAFEPVYSDSGQTCCPIPQRSVQE
jgi:hypothetical protein